MEAIGFSIMWFMAFIHVLGVLGAALSIGKPRTEMTSTTLYVQAGMAILFIYALVLISASR